MPARKLSSSRSFDKSFRKFIVNRPILEESCEKALIKLQENIFDPSLRTHRLSGTLYGLYACSCGYDCRITFTIEKDKTTGEEIILLIGIGTHDEVY